LLEEMVADSQRAGNVIHGIRSLVRKEKSVRTPLALLRPNWTRSFPR
jgi:hypothetical protein